MSKPKTPRPPGRPPTYTKEDIDKIIKACEDYTANTPVPRLIDFAHSQGFSSQLLKDHASRHPELALSLKKLIEKKEDALEQGMITGKMPPAAAIFSLKQLGWRDKQEVEHSGTVMTLTGKLAQLARQKLKKE